METTATIKTVRKQRWVRPALGTFIVIVSSLAISLSGNSATVNVLMLFPLLALFWFLERFSRTEMGFAWGKLRHYGLALLYPIIVLGIIGLVAWIAGATNFENTDWAYVALTLLVRVLAMVPYNIVTEEGFFRGWLWASLRRAGLNRYWIVLLTSLAFAVWHLPIALIDTGFTVPLSQVPVYAFSVILGGVIFGLIRLISGSVIVASVSHGFWNGIGYTLLGQGAVVGALGIQDTATFGPEIGVMGIAMNVLFAALLLLWSLRVNSKAAANQDLSRVPEAQSQKVV